jgi:hypothetical protein
VNDIRQRLADALREHLLWPGTHCRCDHQLDGSGGPGERRSRYQTHLAEVLLSLPGIAIVELPDRLPGYTEGEMPRWETAEIVVQTDHHDWVRLNSEALEPWEARALAVRLLAAANAVEAVQ